MSHLRIFVADDHDLTRSVISALLTSHPGWEVCGEASDGLEAVKKIAEIKPDISVLDVAMPNKTGLEATHEIMQKDVSQKIIILTPTESEPTVREIFNAGARGFVVKARIIHDLNTAVEALERGRSFFGSRFADLIVREHLAEDRANGNGATTDREREDLQRLAKEITNPAQPRNPRGDMRHPLRKYAIALFIVVAAAAAAWLTYTDQWDRPWPAFHKLSTKIAPRSDAPALEPGNPDAKVWIDIHTGLYYCPGDDHYGKTPRGHYAKQSDAQIDRFEPAALKACE